MKLKPVLKRKIQDGLFRFLSALATFLALGALVWLIYTIFHEGASALSFDFLTQTSRPSGEGGGGIGNALLGSLLITLCASALALPPGLATGIWLSEYGKNSPFAQIVRFAINALLGIPSVLVGLFVYGLVVTTMGHFSGFAGSVALALIMFPIVVRTTEDSLATVSFALRESSLALGSTRTRTTLAIVCRQAWGGLITGILLALARVSGETAPLLFTALYQDSWPTHFASSPTSNTPIFILNATMDSPFDAMHQQGWGAVLVISGIILTINICVRLSVRKGNQ